MGTPCTEMKTQLCGSFLFVCLAIKSEEEVKRVKIQILHSPPHLYLWVDGHRIAGPAMVRHRLKFRSTPCYSNCKDTIWELFETLEPAWVSHLRKRDKFFGWAETN